MYSIQPFLFSLGGVEQSHSHNIGAIIGGIVGGIGIILVIFVIVIHVVILVWILQKHFKKSVITIFALIFREDMANYEDRARPTP